MTDTTYTEPAPSAVPFDQAPSSITPEIPVAEAAVIADTKVAEANAAAVEAAVKDPTVASVENVVSQAEGDVKPVEASLQVAQTAWKETKAGYKTTEFWGTIAAAVFAAVAHIPATDKSGILGVLASAYAVARGVAKNGVPAPADDGDISV